MEARLDGTQRDDDNDDDARMNGDRRGAFVTTCIHAARDVPARNNIPIMITITISRQLEVAVVFMTQF